MTLQDIDLKLRGISRSAQHKKHNSPFSVSSVIVFYLILKVHFARSITPKTVQDIELKLGG